MTSRASTSSARTTTAKTLRTRYHRLRVSLNKFSASLTRTLEEEVDAKDAKPAENGTKTGPTPQKAKVVPKEDESLSPFSDEEDEKPGE